MWVRIRVVTLVLLSLKGHVTLDQASWSMKSVSSAFHTPTHPIQQSLSFQAFRKRLCYDRDINCIYTISPLILCFKRRNTSVFRSPILIIILLFPVCSHGTSHLETGAKIINEEGKNVGKLRGCHGNHGLALLRVAKW